MKRFAPVALSLALATALLALSGCGAPAAQEPAAKPATAAAFPVTITDDAGREVTIDAKPARIVSLAPANTEIVYALGALDRVVGVTDYDDYPAEVADIAKVGDFSGPNIEAVAAAKPDLILATTGVQADVIAKLEALGATVLAFDPQSFDGLYEDITETGAAIGEADAAATLVDSMKTEVEQVRTTVGVEEPVSAFVEIGQNPLYTVGTGTLINEMITLAGGENVVTEPSYVPYSAEQVVAADPMVYMATLGSMSDPKELAKRAGFEDLTAVKTGRVVVLDDNLVSRPGPRVVEGLKQIAAALHPEVAGQ